MPQRSTLAQAIGLLAWLAVAFAAAGVGAVASVDAGSFYAQLAKPAWAPPASVFGPVWSVLYFLMGIAAWLAWREQGTKGSAVALGLFLAQLIANALWSWFFFAWRNGAAAFAGVLILLVLIVATMVTFWRIRRLSSLLLVPYLAWVCFASALTWAVWQSNQKVL
jgi:tryptophan-rich sensory protein